MANKAEKLIEALEPVVEEHGLELVTIEIAGTNKNPILRIYLDTYDEGGITLDHLAGAQEWLDEHIEALDPFQDSYMLEVSSPGIDRPLRKLSDFERFADEDVVIYTKPGDKRTKYTGVLKGVEEENVLVECDGETTALPYERIKKANIIGRIDFNAKAFEALEASEDTTE